MVSLTYFNCLRASNLKSITLKDVGKINPNDKIDRARLKKRKIQNITVIWSEDYSAKSNPSATDQVVYRKHKTLCYKRW